MALELPAQGLIPRSKTTHPQCLQDPTHCPFLNLHASCCPTQDPSTNGLLPPPLIPAQKTQLNIKAPRPCGATCCETKSDYRFLQIPPYQEVDHQTTLQGILTSKVGSRYLRPGLTPLSIFLITQVGSSLEFDIRNGHSFIYPSFHLASQPARHPTFIQ